MKLKRMIALILCILFLAVIPSGCSSDAEETTDKTASESIEEEGVYITLYLSSEVGEETDKTAVSPTNVTTLDDLTTTMVAIVPENSLNAETIVSEYNQLVIMSLYGETVVVNAVKEDGNQVWVDFDSESLKALPIEEGKEGQLFYYLARSITDNLGDVDDVYLTMDGGQDFRLAHLWFEASRPFYSGAVPTEGE